MKITRGGPPPLAELHELEEMIGKIRGGLAAVKDPLAKVHETIGRALKLTGIPKTLYDDLKAGKTVLDILDDVSGLLGWLPGPVGGALKAINKVLHPVMRQGGPYDEILKVSKQMADRLVPLRNSLQRLDHPLVKTIKPLQELDGRLAKLESGVKALIARCERGDVPENTQACAEALSARLRPFLDAVNMVRDRALVLVRKLQPVLDQINAALTPVSETYDRLHAVLELVQKKAVQDALRLLKKAAEPLNAARKFIEYLGDKAYDFIKTHFHIDLRALERVFDDLVNRFLKPFRDLIGRLEDKVQRALDKITAALRDLVDIGPATELLEKLDAARDRVSREIESTLAGVCKSALGGPTRARLGRRRRAAARASRLRRR